MDHRLTLTGCPTVCLQGRYI